MKMIQLMHRIELKFQNLKLKLVKLLLKSLMTVCVTYVYIKVAVKVPTGHSKHDLSKSFLKSRQFMQGNSSAVYRGNKISRGVLCSIFHS